MRFGTTNPTDVLTSNPYTRLSPAAQSIVVSNPKDQLPPPSTSPTTGHNDGSNWNPLPPDKSGGGGGGGGTACPPCTTIPWWVLPIAVLGATGTVWAVVDSM